MTAHSSEGTVLIDYQWQTMTAAGLAAAGGGGAPPRWGLTF
jgi:hypothetical protein